MTRIPREVREMKTHRSFGAILLVLITAGPVWSADRPFEVRLGSPGGPGIAAVFSPCPTFTWSALPEAEGFRLVVYDARAGSRANRSSPLFEIQLPMGFSAFQHCLKPGDRYGWAVAALVGGVEHWSEPAVFEVVGPRARPSEPRIANLSQTSTAAHPSFVPPIATPSSDAVLAVAAAPRSLPGASFSPPACTGAFFGDVDASNPFCSWIEQLGRDRITDPDVGCGGDNFCPKAPVTREQAALLLERSMRGTDTFRPGSTTADIPNRTPGATTLTPFLGVNDVGLHTSITIGADGLGLISFYDNTDHDLEVAHCHNLECSTANFFTLDSVGDVGQYTSITIGTDGLGLISYYDNTNFALKVAHCGDVECSTATLATLESGGAEVVVGEYSAITIGADGRGLISYSYLDISGRALKVAHCSDVACSSASPAPALLDGGNVGYYTSIAIGADGRGLISYHDADNSDLKVAHCSNVNCSAATITPLDTAGNIGEATSITIGADGLGLISYRYPGADQGNLKVAHCANVNCTAASIITPIDTTDTVGLSTSITLGADGLGVVSYYDVVNKSLKVAHCSKVDCSAATIVTLDTSSEIVRHVGQYNAITIGADGLPLISYYDETNGDLKVAHCPNVLCAPYFRRR